MVLIIMWMLNIYYKSPEGLMTDEVELDLLDINAAILGLVLPEFETLIVKGVFDQNGELTYEEVNDLLQRANIFQSQ